MYLYTATAIDVLIAVYVSKDYENSKGANLMEKGNNTDRSNNVCGVHSLDATITYTYSWQGLEKGALQINSGPTQVVLRNISWQGKELL